MRSSVLPIPGILILALTMGSCTYRFYSPACDMPAPGMLVKQCELDSIAKETSGLLYLDRMIWTFNDSGGEPSLYCINPENGRLLRTLEVEGASNSDWEDMCMDSSYVYIADVGNNFATRDTLEIYRIPLGFLRNNDTCVKHEGIIRLVFKEKAMQNSKGLSSLDCEALLSRGDSLYLFTKDWLTQGTSVYSLPKVPGHYLIEARQSYEARVLVTGADLDGESKRVALVGYRNYMPVLIIYRFEGSPAHISCGGRGRIYPLRAGRQTEGICFDDRGRLFISSERSLKKQSLFRMGAELR